MSPSNAEFPTFPDLGHHFITKIEQLWFTDFFVLVCLALTLFQLFFFDSQLPRSAMRIFNVLGVVYLLRGASLVATVLPDPRMGCERITSRLFTTFTLHRCGDCIFSGHMSIITVMILHWSTQRATGGGHRTLLFNAMKVLMYGCGALGAWAILANRAHYTVDLVIAIYACLGIWWGYDAYWWDHGKKANNTLLLRNEGQEKLVYSTREQMDRSK